MLGSNDPDYDALPIPGDNAFDDVIKNMKGLNARLQDAKTSRESFFKRRKELVANIIAQIGLSQGQTEQLKAQILGYNAKNTELEKELEDLRLKLGDGTSKSETLVAELNKAREELSKKEEENIKLSGKIAGLKAQLASINEEHDKTTQFMDSKVTQSQGDRDQLTAERDELTAERDQLTTEKDVLGRQIVQMQQEIGQHEGTHEGQRENIEQLQEKVRTLEEQTRNQQEVIKRLKKIIIDAEKAINQEYLIFQDLLQGLMDNVDNKDIEYDLKRILEAFTTTVVVSQDASNASNQYPPDVNGKDVESLKTSLRTRVRQHFTDDGGGGITINPSMTGVANEVKLSSLNATALQGTRSSHDYLMGTSVTDQSIEQYRTDFNKYSKAVDSIGEQPKFKDSSKGGRRRKTRKNRRNKDRNNKKKTKRGRKTRRYKKHKKRRTMR